jgi:hypothetical protein
MYFTIVKRTFFMGALHDYSFLTCKSDMVVCQELQPGPFLLGSFHAAVFPLAVVFGFAATVQVSSFSTGLATTHQPLMCPRWRAMFISSRFTRVCHCKGGFGDFVPQIFTYRLFVQDQNIFFKRVSEGQICDTAAWILHCYGFGIVASPYCSSVTSVRLFRDRMVLAGSSFHPGGLDDWVRCQGAVPDFGAR